MPRHPRRIGRHKPSSAHGVRGVVPPEPGGTLRALVEEGIVTAAALTARDDLDLAAASMQRLGALTSGMWRALSRELVTAAQRLDGNIMDRLLEIERRARTLGVDREAVLSAGFAAGHLAEHRERLDTLFEPTADAYRLLQPDMLYGFATDVLEDDLPLPPAESAARERLVGHPPGVGEPPEAASAAMQASELDVDDDGPPLAERVTLFLWPAPLTPALLSIVSSPPEGATPETLEDVALEHHLMTPPPLLEALTAASGLSAERVTEALSVLGVACWSAHHLDELDDDELEEDDDDVADDGGS
jgi:hypothetical protein